MNTLLNILGGLTILAGAAVLAWFALQPEWRRLRNPYVLELRRFAVRQKTQAGKAGCDTSKARAAEVRCTFCSYAPECAKRLAEGHTTPVSDCPNLSRR